MADGKWIADLTAQTPLADAARWVLAVRLEVVREHLRLALREPEKDIEHVHRLRVGTRRAGAALDLFETCFPKNEYKCARKYLRKLRRGAGAARDWDVFLLTLSEGAVKRTSRQAAGFDFLQGYALTQRVAAQEILRQAGADFPFAFERFMAETLGAIRAPHGDHGRQTLLDLARPLLTELLRNLEEAARRDLDDYENLHRVRIAGKRLRYAMEVFAPCFAPAFKDKLYPAVEAMQDILGEANDSHVASLRLQALRGQIKAFQPAQWSRFRPGIEGLLRYHQRRLPQRRQEFVAWWKKWEETRVEEAFADLLRDVPLPPAEAQVLSVLGSYGVTGEPTDGKTGFSGAGKGGIDRGAPSPGPEAGTAGGPLGAGLNDIGGGAGGGGEPSEPGTGAGVGGPTTGGPGGVSNGPGAGDPTGRGAKRRRKGARPLA